MRDLALEIKIIASAEPGGALNRTFTHRVMHAVHQLESPDASSGYRPSLLRALKSNLVTQPRALLALATIIATLLASGTVYAAYRALWPQPNVDVTVQSEGSGATQVLASLHNCESQQIAARFELLQGNKLSEVEIKKILQAHCEMSNISKWSGENAVQPNLLKPPKSGAATSESTMLYPSPGKVTSNNPSSITLTEGQRRDDITLPLTDKTLYIADDSYVSRDSIRSGDTVLFIQSITSSDITSVDAKGDYVMTGVPTSKKITYVIKMSLPLEYYTPQKQQLLAERQTCTGNSQDTCFSLPAIDVYRAAPRAQRDTERRVVQGVVSEVSVGRLLLSSTSGRQFTVSLPSKLADERTMAGGRVDDMTLQTGDLVEVSYLADRSDESRNLSANQLSSISLILEATQKSKPVKKYTP